MFGIFLFWFHYIIAAIALYTIIRGTYKIKKSEDGYYKTSYEKTNERYKRPLWQILTFILVFLVPVLNLLVLLPYIGISSNECKNELYYKSFITKEY